ncbi:hypothetical protein DUI87_16228 [Hirundo rustica rustica]|uniref:Uncharacterized protein n=1 Tax=Hirundo rustica rustica TaxID=333673 RepID=A0A3M0K0M8_HIRRU|nr:hypothetical protein DUI87_16228 [Hirundo rustica rustica]
MLNNSLWGQGRNWKPGLLAERPVKTEALHWYKFSRFSAITVDFEARREKLTLTQELLSASVGLSHPLQSSYFARNKLGPKMFFKKEFLLSTCEGIRGIKNSNTYYPPPTPVNTSKTITP